MAERSYLSIGQVVNYLRSSYPDLSNSKIRFLEDEGLISPHRTPKGYRQYSKEDVDRIEVILHLQKTRYMPLNVIKQRLDNATDLSSLAYEVGLLSDVPLKTEPKETQQKLHPIEDIPDLLGVKISFLRQLAENDLIKIVKSPKNRELIDGRDFPIIRSAAELARFNIEPRNLRQYVLAANRESTMFEQVLTGMLGSDTSEDDRDTKIERAFDKLHDLTDGIQTALLKNRVFETLNVVVNDADLNDIDEQMDEKEAKRASGEEAGTESATSASQTGDVATDTVGAAEETGERSTSTRPAAREGNSRGHESAPSKRRRSTKNRRVSEETAEPLPLPGLDTVERSESTKSGTRSHARRE